MIGEQFWECPRLPSHVLEQDQMSMIYGHGPSLAAELARKVQAEEERLLRLLPDPTPGHSWEFQTEKTEDLEHYMTLFRVVAVLKENT